MFKLRDFLHIPQLDPLFEELVSENSGLILLSGLDPRQVPQTTKELLLPSGRSAIFNIVLQEILANHPGFKAIIIASDKSTGQVARQFKRRTSLMTIESPEEYPEKILEATRRKPDLLVIDRITPGNIAAVFEAAHHGVFVLTQLDSIFCGAEAIRHLLDLGAPEGKMDTVRWILSVHRLPRLCPQCKQQEVISSEGLRELIAQYPDLAILKDRTFTEKPDGGTDFEQAETNLKLFRPHGCKHCHNTGRFGEIATFDVFYAEKGAHNLRDSPSQLPLDRYILHLVLLGHLPLEDYLRFEKDLLHRTYRLLTENEKALEDTNIALKRRLLELEASNRVLERRTTVLVSLQDIVQLLNTSRNLTELANSLCRKASKLCEADRTILYFRRERKLEILAVAGWSSNILGRMLDPDEVFFDLSPAEPSSFLQLPPGISAEMGTNPQLLIKAGLKLPLIVEDNQVGLMIVQSTRKYSFSPGERSLLETFAHQASLAIQRAALIDDLQTKIVELEAAQTELIKKERMEHELALARQMQQSMLPVTFPAFTGFRFAARNESARQVGGDFYDVIDIDSDHFGVVIGDVSDKGMPAALYMALTRSLLLAEARRESSPRQVLQNINNILMEIREPRQFVSIFYGVVEKASRRFTYCRAGHEYPLWFRNGVFQILSGEGSILGVMDNKEFILSEEEIRLEHGDRIVLYTDGLTDAMNKEGVTFDFIRFQSLLESLSGRSANEICSGTFEEIFAFQKDSEQFDDMTMLVVEVE